MICRRLENFLNNAVLTLINVAPFQWLRQKGSPLRKMAMFEEDIWLNKDEGVGPIGPKATSIWRTAKISLLSS
jgi:hypothetical protein